jgi:hypothetical protein
MGLGHPVGGVELEGMHLACPHRADEQGVARAERHAAGVVDAGEQGDAEAGGQLDLMQRQLGRGGGRRQQGEEQGEEQGGEQGEQAAHAAHDNPAVLSSTLTPT